LYLLIRELRDDVREVKAKLRWQRSEQSNELSSQVLDDVYTNIVKHLFPQDVYSSQSTFKESLKDYFEKMYPEFMSNISTNEFTNRFHAEWSIVINFKLVFTVDISDISK
ncbi:8012_t:CDS:2, partial [Racocetra persica]